MARYQNEDNHFVELAMKITSDRATLTMRVMALEQLLAQQGIDVSHIMSADKQELARILTPPGGAMPGKVE